LDSVVPQVEDDVEVFVSDNASTDGTGAMMMEYCGVYKFIRYMRNQTNIGPDANYLQCFRQGRGKYVHLLSDDDILLAGSVRAIKNCIKSQESLSVLFLNNGGFVGSSSQMVIKPNYHFRSDLVFEDKNDFLNLVNIEVTYISSLVLNKECIERVEFPEKYIGTHFLPSHLFLECLKHRTHSAFVAHLCVAHRFDNAGRIGYDYYTVWALNYKNLICSTGKSSDFRKSTLRNAYLRVLWRLGPSTVAFKSDKEKSASFSNKITLIKATWKYPVSWIYIYPFAFSPPWLLRLIKMAGVNLRSLRRREK
jgi:glycosyltransferase involved in cell wall biosynthesis